MKTITIRFDYDHYSLILFLVKKYNVYRKNTIFTQNIPTYYLKIKLTQKQNEADDPSKSGPCKTTYHTTNWPEPVNSGNLWSEFEFHPVTS